MNLRNNLVSSLGLVALIGCSGGGGGDTPKPPTPTVTTTSTMSAVRNLDNPGATTSYVGDRLEADLDIAVVTKDFTGTPAYVDTFRIAYDGITPQLYQGGNVPTIHRTLNWNADAVTEQKIITPTGDVRVYNTVKSTTDQVLFTYNTAVHTIKPAELVYKAGPGDLVTNKAWYVQKLKTIPLADGTYASETYISNLIDQVTNGNNSDYELLGREYDHRTILGQDGQSRRAFRFRLTQDGTNPIATETWLPLNSELYELEKR